MRIATSSPYAAMRMSRRLTIVHDLPTITIPRLAASILVSIDRPRPMLRRPVTKGATMRTESPVRGALSAISPLFVVSDLRQALAFYRERLGFEVTHQEPAPDPFFAIVARDGVQILLKVVA